MNFYYCVCVVFACSWTYVLYTNICECAPVGACTQAWEEAVHGDQGSTSGVFLYCSPPHFNLLRQGLSLSGAAFSWTDMPVTLQDTPLSDLPLQCWRYVNMYVTAPGLYTNVWNPDSGPHTCMADISPAKQSPQPRSQSFNWVITRKRSSFCHSKPGKGKTRSLATFSCALSTTDTVSSLSQSY